MKAEGKVHLVVFIKTSDSLWNTSFSESKVVVE